MKNRKNVVPGEWRMSKYYYIIITRKVWLASITGKEDMVNVILNQNHLATI